MLCFELLSVIIGHLTKGRAKRVFSSMKSERNSQVNNSPSHTKKKKHHNEKRSDRPQNEEKHQGSHQSSSSSHNNTNPNRSKNQKVQRSNNQIQPEERKQIASDQSFETQAKKSRENKFQGKDKEEVKSVKSELLPNNDSRNKVKSRSQSSFEVVPPPGERPAGRPHKFMEMREHEWNPVTPLTSSILLNMDTDARLQMFKRMPMKQLLQLRATCRRIKNEIDHSVGISLIIDDRKSSFYKIAPYIGIQQMRIYKLTEDSFIPFLLHGVLLKILVIDGDISSKYATYIFESCPNICHLTINFTPYLFSNYVPLFPIQYPALGEEVGALPNMTYLRIQCRTTSSRQFVYALENLYYLITVDLKAANLRRIHVSFHNESTTKNMENLHASLSYFVNVQAQSLQNLHMSVSQDKPMRVHHKTEFNKHHRTSHRVKHQPDFEHYTEFDSRSEDMIISWNDFPVLSKAVLRVNKCAYFWIDCLSKASAMTSLSIDLKVPDNWSHYIIAIAASSKTLQIIQLHSVNRGNSSEILSPVPRIDFSVFRKLKKLTRLELECKADELVGVYYRISNIRSVCQAKTLELSWISLRPGQLSTLLICSRRLRQLELAYCSRSNGNFRKYFILCRWILALHFTRVRVISILDNKLRFQYGKAAMKRFLKAQWKHTAYYEGFYWQAVYSRAIKNPGKYESRQPYTTTFNDKKIENPSSDTDDEDDF